MKVISKISLFLPTSGKNRVTRRCRNDFLLKLRRLLVGIRKYINHNKQGFKQSTKNIGNQQIHIN